MIGFDRPLKPEWIVRLLSIIEPGTPAADYYPAFDEIAQELIGKEGKKKARKIVFRAFIFSLQASKNIIEENPFITWAQSRSLTDLKPLLLAKILMDYPVTRFITQKIEQNMDQENRFSSTILQKKMVQEYGDRDVVKRSVRSFLRTLQHFGLLSQIDQHTFVLAQKLSITDEQLRDFLILYGRYHLHTSSIDLSHIDTSLLYYFGKTDVERVARKYHQKEWEYIRDAGREFIIFVPV
jgi:hypothetical protein